MPRLYREDLPRYIEKRERESEYSTFLCTFYSDTEHMRPF